MTAGGKIFEMRNSLNMTQERLGEIVGASRQTVSKWELDEAFPEPRKLVLLCRALGMSADELLSYLADSDDDEDDGGYGIWRGTDREIVITPGFALVFSSGASKIEARLYRGDSGKKSLIAICVRDREKSETLYAYAAETSGEVICSGDAVRSRIGEPFDTAELSGTRLIEPLRIDTSPYPMPSVSVSGVAECLSRWRNRISCGSDRDSFGFTMCTKRLEYVFSIYPERKNIYCGASNNRVFDLGLIGGRQYFRFRNYDDNTSPFCAFSADFGYEPTQIPIPECTVSIADAVSCQVTGDKNVGSSNLVFFVKRFSDDHIVLAGCGGDEYHYYRDFPWIERIV